MVVVVLVVMAVVASEAMAAALLMAEAPPLAAEKAVVAARVAEKLARAARVCVDEQFVTAAALRDRPTFVCAASQARSTAK